MPVIESMELAQVLSEAGDIARNVNQRLTSAHHLLAFFVVPNRAEMLLRERGVDEDRILLAMSGAPEEPDGLERDIRERARQVAEGLRADETDCLHLLIAMTRVRHCAAHQLLAACGLELAALRNVALSYYTAGMPRRLRRVPQPATRAPAPPAARRTVPMRDVAGGDDLDLEAGDDDTEGGLGGLDLSPRPDPRPAGAAATRPDVRARAAHALDPAEFPWLSHLGRNLTELAAAGRLDPL
ncbi:MAG: ATP-dependent Clp protease ATP-binding subunit, partial [Deltaproteobacteria bacterium]|nr:ATP-dependent Clp protease ATP-binding subunit [Deltaproteobacteria bacterium]